MSLDNPDEGNPTQPTGEAESPTSQTSGEAGQPLPDTLKLVLDRLEKTEALVKGLQKGTDKQIGQVRSDVKRILELKENGMTEAQIQRELQLDALLGGQNAPSAEPVGKQEPSEPDLDVESTLKAMQFEENDVALAALKVVHGNNKSALLKSAATLRLQQLAVKPAGPAGALSPSGGNTGSSKITAQQIEDGYNAEMEKIPRGSAHTFQRAEVKKKWRAKAREAGYNLNV